MVALAVVEELVQFLRRQSRKPVSEDGGYLVRRQGHGRRIRLVLGTWWRRGASTFLEHMFEYST